MPVRKPPSRRASRRTSLNDPRRLSQRLPTVNVRSALAARVRFGSHPKHKKNPAAYRLPPYRGPDEDATYCDEHANFRPAQMRSAVALLRRGIAAGLFGKSTNQGMPTLLWTVDDNGWIYEARITNPGNAEYHGYPVLPNEAIARKVLTRYADYVAQQNVPNLATSLQLARRRYR